MVVAADHEIDRTIEFLDDVDDGAGDRGALIVVAGRIAALVNQDDNGFNAARLQFGHECIYGLRLIAKFQARGARRRNNAGSAFQGQADEGYGNAVEFPDFVGWKNRLPGRGLDRGGGEIVKLRAREGMRPAAVIDRMTAAILHPLEFVLAFVEFVV